MKKIKGEPGEFIEIEEVKKRLKQAAYGASDLVELGLFHSDHFVRDAIHEGKLKFQRVNKQTIIVCRDDIIEYWLKHRNTPYDPPNHSILLKFNKKEVDFIQHAIHHAQQKVDRSFTKEDLFRNFIKYFSGTGIDSHPQLFTKPC